MITITKATLADVEPLLDVALQSFIETHEEGVPADALAYYISTKLTLEAFTQELSDPFNIFHIIHYNGRAAGYSKIIFNTPYPAIAHAAVTKLERLYLLREYHDKKLGAALFTHATDLSKKAGQAGIWLYVWKVNERAIRFYRKAGFKIVGSADFKISDTHYNPNHIMYLTF